MTDARLAVLLALACCPILVGVHLASLRLRRSTERDGHDERALSFGILAYGLAWAALWGTTQQAPGDVGQLVFAALAGLSTLGCVVLVYGESYFLVERGFSLQMLVDLAQAQKAGLSLEEVAARYSQGRGLDWLMEKRLSLLTEFGLITRHQGRVMVQAPLGLWCGWISLALKAWLRLGPGG